MWRATPLPPGNERMVRVPEGALVLPNRVGTAPGLVLDVDGRMVVLLPGVPSEMRALFSDGVVPLLRRRLGDRLLPLVHRVFHTTGIAESSLAERIDAGLPANLGPVSIAFLPRLTGVDLRLTARATPGRPACLPLARPGRDAGGAGGAADTSTRLTAETSWSPSPGRWSLRGAPWRSRRVARAVLVARRITELAGSSEYFLGGVVTYADDAKRTHLGVPGELMAGHGAVSEEVARAMARGVVRAFGADAGLAVTGVAGPGGGSAEKPVGTVWYAVPSGRPHGSAPEHLPRGAGARFASGARRRCSRCSTGACGVADPARGSSVPAAGPAGYSGRADGCRRGGREFNAARMRGRGDGAGGPLAQPVLEGGRQVRSRVPVLHDDRGVEGQPVRFSPPRGSRPVRRAHTTAFSGISSGREGPPRQVCSRTRSKTGVPRVNMTPAASTATAADHRPPRRRRRCPLPGRHPRSPPAPRPRAPGHPRSARPR